MIIFNIPDIPAPVQLPRLQAFCDARASGALANACVLVENTAEALLANAAGAAFIASKAEFAKELAELAEFYLFDAKILVFIKSEEELAKAASLRADAACIDASSPLCVD